MADRSLAFFITLANQQNKPDPNTGIGTTPYAVQYNVNKFDPNDPLNSQSSEKKDVNYNVVSSLQSEGQFINYLGNSTTNNYRAYTLDPEHESDIKLSNIIDWTQKNHPSMKLNAFHFAYLKYFNVYPANRLMVLRRFPNGINHDLFMSQVSPIHTMVGYYDLEDSPYDISFSEDWTTSSASVLEVLQDVIGIDFDDVPGIGEVFKLGNKLAQGSNLQQTLLYTIGKKLGILNSDNVPYGDPDVIYESAIRNTDPDEFSSGLKSEINLEFKTTYIMREIGGIDSKAAMLDIIANVAGMATSNSKFLVTGNFAGNVNKIINDLESGNTEQLFTDIISAFTDVLNNVISAVSDGINSVKKAADDISKNPAEGVAGAITAIVGQIEDIASTLLKSRYLRYKWQLRGAIGAMAGLPTAPWHITLGNPKFPWFVCGNLILDGCKIESKGELGYNDIPTELEVTIKLKAGRSMGAGEIANLFNAGKGRIYDTPDSIQRLSIPNNTNAPLPGNASADTPTNNTNPTNDSASTTNDTTDTDNANDLPNTSDFSLNNQDSDNNLDPLNNNNNYNSFV